MLVIPDIHGRSFWQEAVSQWPREEVVFLGDYLDPYPREGLGSQDALSQLKAVIRLKQERPEDVVLLLGNHDLEYLNLGIYTTSRHDFLWEEAFQALLIEHRALFRIAHTARVAGRDFIFTHAGLHPDWIAAHANLLGEDMSYTGIANRCNELFAEAQPGFIDALTDVSRRRGGDCEAGSPLWADVSEYTGQELPADVYQVFGHTQQRGGPVITPQLACIDCRMAFRLNRKGVLSPAEKKRSHLKHLLHKLLDWEGDAS